MNAAPRVRANDWSVLRTAVTPAPTPALTVSVVIPAYRAEETLPYTLASLTRQTYPSHLVEILVVDDSEDGTLQLPEVRPQNTRIVRPAASWGRANACATGAEQADGDVVQWLDADMVLCRRHLETQMRWHHVIDHAVVLGHKTFIDRDALPDLPTTLEALDRDDVAGLLEGSWRSEHDWVEEIWRNTDDLTSAGFRAFEVHVGATASVGRALYGAAGGMDRDLKLGEDIEVGYRLAGKGGVFIADREAMSWHLGRSTLMQRESLVKRYNEPFIAHRVPDFRRFRQRLGRTYRVPLIEAVVDAHGKGHEEIRHTVDGVLEGAPGDVGCLILGPWSQLHDERRPPLDDPLLEARLIHAEYSSEPRVRLVETLTPTAFPAAFRMQLPAGWRPGRKTMEQAVQVMQREALGLRSVLLPDGQVVRFERTAAFERARRTIRPQEDLDDVVDLVSGSWWSEGIQDGFRHPGHATAERRPGPSTTATSPARLSPVGRRFRRRRQGDAP